MKREIRVKTPFSMFIGRISPVFHRFYDSLPKIGGLFRESLSEQAKAKADIDFFIFPPFLIVNAVSSKVLIISSLFISRLYNKRHNFR